MEPTHSPLSSHRVSRRWTLHALAASAWLFAGAGCATTPTSALVSLEVHDRDSGQLLTAYNQHDRWYVPGRPGARYAVRLRNHSAARVLVVLSVDGVNVISGQTADWSQTGYVLDPGRWYDINGWRKSDTQVAAFEFAPLEQSYAARTGRPDHVGVIGMAVFRERPPPAPPVAVLPPPPPAPQLSSRGEARPMAPTAAAPAAAATERQASADSVAETRAAAKLGTGHGAREWSVSRRTAFERNSSTPDQVTQIEYDSLERLVAAGVIPAPWRPVVSPRPRPFPASPMAYVPDPPRW